jgi:hypothetical protein
MARAHAKLLMEKSGHGRERERERERERRITTHD